MLGKYGRKCSSQVVTSTAICAQSSAGNYYCFQTAYIAYQVFEGEPVRISSKHCTRCRIIENAIAIDHKTRCKFKHFGTFFLPKISRGTRVLQQKLMKNLFLPRFHCFSMHKFKLPAHIKTITFFS